MDAGKYLLFALMGALILLTPSPAAFARGNSLDGHLLFTAPWGSGGGGLGRVDPNESDGLAPSSFAVAPWGDIYILDEVNSRVAVFSASGGFLRELWLPSTTFAGLDFAPDCRLILLDRLVRRSLLLIDELTGETEELALADLGIAETGLVTAMLVSDDGVWLEEEHRSSVRVLDANLSPGDFVRVPGRPRLDGRGSLLARMEGRGAALLDVLDAVGDLLCRCRVEPDRPLARLVWVRECWRGTWFIYHLLGPEDGVGETIHAVLLDSSGAELARVTTPHEFTFWHQFREFRVLPDGGLIRLVFDDAGVSVLRWRLP